MIFFTNVLQRYREWRIKRRERLLIDLLNRMKKVAGSK